jgi:hypothetical protein
MTNSEQFEKSEKAYALQLSLMAVAMVRTYADRSDRAAAQVALLRAALEFVEKKGCNEKR